MGSEMSEFYARIGKICAYFSLCVNFDTLTSHLYFDFMIVTSGWVDGIPFTLHLFLLWRYLYDIQWVVHTISSIVSFYCLFVVRGRNKLELILSWFLHLHLHMFPVILYPPIPIIHVVLWPGCLPYFFLVDYSLWSSLRLSFLQVFMVFARVNRYPWVHNYTPCNKHVLLLSTSLQFLEDFCTLFFLITSVDWSHHLLHSVAP